jgi:hypothetical protein
MVQYYQLFDGIPAARVLAVARSVADFSGSFVTSLL